MFIHEFLGITNRIDVLHEPTGLRFAIWVRLQSPEPRASFETSLEAPADPRLQREIDTDTGWRTIQIGPHRLTYTVALRGSWPIWKALADPEFRWSIVNVAPHPRVQSRPLSPSRS